jgi:hypothetical protein
VNLPLFLFSTSEVPPAATIFFCHLNTYHHIASGSGANTAEKSLRLIFELLEYKCSQIVALNDFSTCARVPFLHFPEYLHSYLS